MLKSVFRPWWLNLRLEARRPGGSEAHRKNKKGAAAQNSKREWYRLKTAFKVRKRRRLKERRKHTYVLRKAGNAHNEMHRERLPKRRFVGKTSSEIEVAQAAEKEPT